MLIESQDKVEYQLDHDNHLLHFSVTGKLTKEVILDQWRFLPHLDGFDPSYDTISDYRGLTDVDISVPDLQDLIRRFPDEDPRIGHIAFVIGPDKGRYYFSKFVSALVSTASKRKVGVFETKDKAQSWLFSLRAPALTTQKNDGHI